MSEISADWARALSDPAEFRREQDDLAKVWTFLGLLSEISRDGDWFSTRLATRSVFVQRFGEELRCFENVCAHRGHPLRAAHRGNGPVICGFHHWHYDREGRLAGAPVSKDLFGKLPQEMGVCLERIEIATCGDLIFGRFAGGSGTLEDFLGDLFPVIEAMTRTDSPRSFTETQIAANWKLYLHATLDDYHLAAVHPSTLGKVGYMQRENVRYARFGLHSAYMYGNDPVTMVAGCKDGSYRSNAYFITQVAPTLAILHAHSFADYYQCSLIQCIPEAHDRSLCRIWMWHAPFEPARRLPLRRLRSFIKPILLAIAARYANRIHREDFRVCEQMQKVAPQIGRQPIIGALEERIVWFEESVERLRGR